MIRILIIDDNEYKIDDSKDALSKIYVNPDMYQCVSRNSALKFLNECKGLIDLIILDWNFPDFNQGMPEVGMGEEILKEMQRKGINIDTIICSSDKVHIENEYHNVIGQILYHPATLKSQYEDILRDKKEIDEYIDTVIERESLIIKSEPEAFQCEYEDDKIMKKNLTRWKRKRSSDAWWKK